MTSKYTLNVQGNMRKICPAPWGEKRQSNFPT